MDLPEKDARPPDALRRWRFENSHWQLDLLVERKDNRQLAISARSEIKNIHVGKRAQLLANPKTNKGLLFRLKQGNNKFDLRVEGEGLPARSETFERYLRDARSYHADHKNLPRAGRDHGRSVVHQCQL